MKRALIFGISGQAGMYLAAYLESLKEYEIVGTYHTAGYRTRSYDEVRQVDIRNKRLVSQLLISYQPDEVYNLASKMFAPASWQSPDEYVQVNFGCVPNILDTMAKYAPNAKYFQAGSASVFDLSHVPQSIYTRMAPQDPYGVSKMAAQQLVTAYRNRGMYACTGVLFNMESPLRADTFFANKVCKEAVQIARSEKALMHLGKLSGKRDWGWTEEYVKAMHLMLQQPVPQDYVIGTGESHSCLEFVQEALRAAGAPPNSFNWDERGSAVLDTLQANTVTTSQGLKWSATIKFKEVVAKLVQYYQKQAIENQYSQVENGATYG